MGKTRTIKLSELTGQIQQKIEESFGNMSFWVVADINSHTFKADTNFHYFELIEKDKLSSRIVARVAARAWGNAAINIRNFERVTGQGFKNDINVLVYVSVQFHATYGLQLNLIDIDTSFTLGKFEEHRTLTLHRLISENPLYIEQSGDRIITRNAKLKFGKVIQHIAVISSETSAGFQDFSHTLSNNSFDYVFKVDPYFTKVQGEANAGALLERLIEVYHSHINYDAVVIIRGGGAQSDFLLFDNYQLSRAVARFPIPVITGIGHQKNETLVDLMAHTSTKTPTKAAEYIIAHNRLFEEGLQVLKQIIVIKSQQCFFKNERILSSLKSSVIGNALSLLKNHNRNLSSFAGFISNRPKILLATKQNVLQNEITKLVFYNQRILNNNSIKLDHFRTIVKIMSPQNILNKGFAIVKINNKIISRSDLIKVGAHLIIQLSDAEIDTVVASKKKHHGN